ncbi:MAG: glycosyltransferase, partial [Lachnospiraceae bacterium]|nr:glycosyltransferase [Lachnospiraceae bacterium]
MDNLLISAIVPVYNTPTEYLEECINSILSQTYTHFELILVDDGSNESCAKLLDDYASKDSRINVIHQPNGGVSAARNNGIEHVTGQVLTFVDSDDSLKPDAWSLAIDALIQYNADCAAFGWTDYCELDTYIQQITEEIRTVDAHTFQVEVGSDNYKCGGGYPWNKLWRIDSLTADGKSIPKFNLELNMYEDKLWVLQAANNIKSVVLLPQLLYNYRFVSSSITQTEEQRIPRLLIAYDAYKIILDYLENVNDKAYVMAYNFCFEFTNNDIRFLSENKSKHKDQIKKSKKALKR